MEIKILNVKEDKLLNREEVTFEVAHEDIGGTPTRSDVKRKLSTLLKRDAELLFIKKIETKRGTKISLGTANVYNSLEEAKNVEPEYIIKRNMPKEEAKETETNV